MAFDKIVDSQWLENLFKSIGNAIRGKTGGTEDIPIEQMPAEITDIQTGVETNDATATAKDILPDKTAYVNGEKITGAMPKAEIVKRKSTVSEAGVVTIESKVSKTGYVTEGDYLPQLIHALIPVGHKTIYPQTTEQVAVPKGRYTMEDVIVEGDEDLIASNIKKGVSIFGVEGNYEGEDVSAELTEQDELLTELATVLESKAAGSAETCTVVISGSVDVSDCVGVTVCKENEFDYEFISLSSKGTPCTIENVVVGSALVMYIYGSSTGFKSFWWDGCEFPVRDSSNMCIFTPRSPICEIYITENPGDMQ